MAKMYPQTLDRDTQSQAERDLFETMRLVLPDDHFVFHSACFQLPSHRGPIRDGEADFFIVHPKKGMLVLEVKGGEIIHNRKQGEWTSIARNGKRHSIKSPFNQAKTAMYRFREMWRAVTNNAPDPIFGHSVAFPDTTVPQDASMGPDVPRAIIMDKVDTARLVQWFDEVFAYYRGANTTRPYQPDPNQLRKFLLQFGGTRHFRPAMWGDIQHEKAEMAELTEQQFLVLDALGRRRRALVSGCAGSGKTMLAVEKAARLASAGHRVLLTCYNKSLASFLRDRLGDVAGLSVSHFHELAHDLAKTAGTLPIDPDYNSGKFFDEVLPEAMSQAIAANPDMRFDAIVVDEAQDFSDTWWLPLMELLEDLDEDTFYIFYDRHQQLYGRQLSLPLAEEPFILSTNCRNTLPIHSAVMRFGGEWTDLARSKGASGRPVAVHQYPEGASLEDVTGELVASIVDKEQVPLERIVLLSPFSRASGKSLLAGHEKIGRFPLTESDQPEPDQLRFSTLHGYKGCEADVVVLVEADRLKPGLSRDALMYVAASRARHHLAAVFPKGEAADLRQALAAGGR
jgi:hypothetical protein